MNFCGEVFCFLGKNKHSESGLGSFTVSAGCATIGLAIEFYGPNNSVWGDALRLPRVGQQ
jgi:hypothetical protein